jgi:hypothetical protein
MRLLVAARPCPPHTRSACSWRCPTTHLLLARRAHKQCLLTATPNNMCFSPAPPPEQNPRHSRPSAPARVAERRQHRAHRHEWHDTARQKREHRTRWYRKEARVARHRTAKTRASHALASKVSPTHATTRYGFGSTSARRNARGARHAGIGLAAFDREVCSGAKLGKVTWRGVSGMGSLYLDR